MEVIVRKSAEKDIKEIYDWYEHQETGLGEDFLEEFARSIPYLESFPVSFRIRYKNFRISSISRFPYLIYFRIVKQTIIVQHVGHAHRSRRKLKL